jgi:hypothetical protein
MPKSTPRLYNVTFYDKDDRVLATFSKISATNATQAYERARDQYTGKLSEIKDWGATGARNVDQLNDTN